MQVSACLENGETFTKVLIDDVEVKNSICTSGKYKFPLTTRRWLVLVSYCLLSCSVSTSWLCFPAVSNIIRKYYNIGLLAVNMLSIIFGIAIVLFSIPFAWLLDKFGLGVTMKVAALLNVFGAFIKYFGLNPEYGYWLLLIGNTFIALSVSGFLFLPGKIASTWFPEKELGKATSICIAFDALGSGVGYLQATVMIDNSDNKSVVKESLKWFLLSQLVPAILIFFFVFFTVKKQPDFAPNMAAMKYTRSEEEHKRLLKLKAEAKCIKANMDMKAEGRDSKTDDTYVKTDGGTYCKRSLKYEILKLLRNFDFQLIIHLQGITASIEGIFEIFLNEMLIGQYPGQESNIGIVGFLAVISGFTSNILVGNLIDRTGSYRKVTIVIFFLTTLCCILWSLLLVYVRNLVVKGFVYCLIMATSTSYYTIALAQGLRVMPTISPSATGVMLVLTSQIYDTITSFAWTEILSAFGANGVNAATIVICFIATCLAFFVKDSTNPNSHAV